MFRNYLACRVVPSLILSLVLLMAGCADNFGTYALAPLPVTPATATPTPTPSQGTTPAPAPSLRPNGGVVTTLAGHVASWGNLIALDVSGNIYAIVGDSISKVTPGGIVTTLAGSGTPGYADGTGTAASFYGPVGIAVDSGGNVVVADSINNRIRKISPGGVVTTLAGSGTPGYADGNGTAASFNFPTGVAIDASGNVFVADLGNNRIRKISPGGMVTTLAGGGSIGFPFNCAGTAADLDAPQNVAVDAGGNVYVSVHVGIIKISTGGMVTFLAGSSVEGFADGTGTAATFNQVMGIAVDSLGNVYVADKNNDRIRKVSPLGVVTTLAGSDTVGSGDGMGSEASFNSPQGVALDAKGNVYVADVANDRIRMISTGAVVTTNPAYVHFYNGKGYSSFSDGTGPAARFNWPKGVAVDASGNVYVADTFNHRIRKISPGGVVATIAGNGTPGYADGTGKAAIFNYPQGIAVDSGDNLYVAEPFNGRIRKISPGGVVTTLAGSGTSGYADGTGKAAIFNCLQGVAVDSGGNVYVTDLFRIRKISPGGVVTTLAGSDAFGYADGTGTTASFYNLEGIAVDFGGNVYVADSTRIRKISSGGVVTTLAGISTAGYADGTGTSSRFSSPMGVAVDSGGNVYVADAFRIRKISPGEEVTTLAGSGTAGYADGLGPAATFLSLGGIAVDALGIVYVADGWSSSCIRKIQ